MSNHSSSTYEYIVRAERASDVELSRKLTEISVLAADLASAPRASEADALMHLVADVLLTLRMNSADKELNSRSFGIG